MVKIKADTNLLADVSAKLEECATVFDDSLLQLSTRIENMNFETGEWVGTSANNYITNFKQDCENYKKLGTILHEYANNINTMASELSFAIGNAESHRWYYG